MIAVYHSSSCHTFRRVQQVEHSEIECDPPESKATGVPLPMHGTLLFSVSFFVVLCTMMSSLRRKRSLLSERRAEVQTGIADMCCDSLVVFFLSAMKVCAGCSLHRTQLGVRDRGQ